MRRPPPKGDRIAVASIGVLALALGGCSFLILAASESVHTGGSARYRLELHNDEVTNSGISAFTVAHVPAGWSLEEASFELTAPPSMGTGTPIPDPGFVCTTGPDLPAPGAGRQRVVISWGGFDAVDPQTATADLAFAVGPQDGVYALDFFFVARKESSTLCSTGQSTTTEVEQAIFVDGFESGDTSAWSTVVP